jgi:hypothetical protein
MFWGGTSENHTYYEMKLSQEYDTYFNRTSAMCSSLYFLDEEEITIKRNAFNMVDVF